MTYDAHNTRRHRWGLVVLLAALGAGGVMFALQDLGAAVVCTAGQERVYFAFSTDPQAELDPFIPFNTPGGTGDIKQTILVESASSGNGLEKLGTEFSIDRTNGTFGTIKGTSGDTFRDTEVTLFNYNKGFMNGEICLKVANTQDPNIYKSDPALIQFDIFRNDNGDLIGAYTASLALTKDADGAFHLNSTPNRDSASNYTVYNARGEQVMQEEMTNYLDPEHPGIVIDPKLAQNLISEAIAILQRADSDRVLLNNPQDAVVLQNYIANIGDSPFVNVNPALNVYNEAGNDIVNHTFDTVNLNNFEGQTIYQERPDGTQLAIPVVNARAGADIIEGTCSGGTANLQATQTYTNKGVQRNMVLIQNGTEVARGETINATINCDAYTLTANTTSRSFTLDEKVYNCGGCPPGVTPTPTPERVTFSGAGDLGIFDPSVARDLGTGRMWMSYSSVDTSIYYVSSLYWAVSVRLAYSDDNGISWQDAGVLVAPKDERLLGPMIESHPTGSIPANSQGIWQSETSSLIYDPSAPLAERWKLIWFQYLNANLTSFFADYSWIAMKIASTPLGLAAATPVKLFGGAGLQPQNTITVAPVFAPIGGAPVIQLNTALTQVPGGADLAELNLCVFAEPGLYATNSAVYLAIFCADAITNPVTEYLVYFRCTSPCAITSATSWEYLGRLLTPADAQAATGDDHFQAPALVEKNGKTYLIVTPVDTTSGNRYNGCRVYEFSDVNSNQLLRNSGQLVEVARIDGAAGTHNGACAAYSGLDGGILLSQHEPASPAETFMIFKSQVSLP
ncbi:MAG: hypothetical protein BMS9Abin30_0464 [Gammaproteobacteria bacterium]|nr:MAG: hypothetical protein BMS9Abin30_0464 [Gammaproteobacteria bacterium]